MVWWLLLNKLSQVLESIRHALQVQMLKFRSFGSSKWGFLGLYKLFDANDLFCGENFCFVVRCALRHSSHRYVVFYYMPCRLALQLMRCLLIHFSWCFQALLPLQGMILRWWHLSWFSVESYFGFTSSTGLNSLLAGTISWFYHVFGREYLKFKTASNLT